MLRNRHATSLRDEQVLTFLESAASTGEPAFSPRLSVDANKARWQERLDATRAACAALIARGGADYDGSDVNAGTVYKVLTGFGAEEGDRIVPRDGSCGALLFAVYSHGWSYAVGDEAMQARLRSQYVCDTCRGKHTNDPSTYDHQHESSFTREWYVNMPYECPESMRDELYGGVATEGHAHAHWFLYWQSLCKAYFKLVQADPERPVVALHNWCGSGGTLKFMERPGYQAYFGVKHWYGDSGHAANTPPLTRPTCSAVTQQACIFIVRCWFDGRCPHRWAVVQLVQ